MQETSSTVIPSTQTNLSQLSDDTPFAKNRTSITNAEFPTVSNNLDLNEFKSSSLWAKKLIGNMVPRQKNFTFSPLNLNTFSGQMKSLNEMLSRSWQVRQSVEHDIEPESTSSSQGLTSFQSGYPICFESKSIYHITNLSVNMKKAYDNSPRFGSLERAHMQWMADNEISANRMTYLRSRKMDMYRNYIFKGANPELRHAIINAFLVQKDLYPKKETTFLSSALNQRLQYVADTCEGWYKIGQNFALGVLNRKNEDDIGSLFSDLEGKKITIDWDKAFHHALRSHSIAQILGIPPHVLFLTGFAAIDIKQIILSDNLKNVEKMIVVAQIVLKTIIKIVVAMGTQLFTSGLLGLGGIDVIDIPFGVHGTRYLESQITERVFKVIDTHFDSMNSNTVKAEKIIDC